MRKSAFFLFFIFAFPLFGKKLPSHPIESRFLEKYHQQFLYSLQNLAVIKNESLYELNKLAALRFLDWAEKNPKGVLAITENTSPFFLSSLKYYKEHWNEEKIQQEISFFGIVKKAFPITSELKIVQLDSREFMTGERKTDLVLECATLLEIKEDHILLLKSLDMPTMKKFGNKILFPKGSFEWNVTSIPSNNFRKQLQAKALQEWALSFKDYQKKIEKWGGIGFVLGNTAFLSKNQNHLITLKPNALSKEAVIILFSETEENMKLRRDIAHLHPDICFYKTAPLSIQ